MQPDAELSAYVETGVKELSQPITSPGVGLFKSLYVVFSTLFKF